jgi:hypothetical protein
MLAPTYSQGRVNMLSTHKVAEVLLFRAKVGKSLTRL